MRPFPVPCQLACDVPDFTGRTTELAQLLSLLPPEAAEESEGVPAISAICGPAGIGKTALAIRFAHQVADRFPAGQLYVNLRGFDPSSDPLSPGEVLSGFLAALGIAPGLIPADVQAQAALFRSLLTRSRTLIVLDNVRDAEQVRPLLPASRGCLVIVTSRVQLIGLIAGEGARPLTLDVLPQDEAIALLTARIGRQRVASELAAAENLVDSCAGLPLALVIVAARAASCPGLPLASIANELRQARNPLDTLTTSDAATDVRTVFSWSYKQLPAQAARVFRLLGLHPGIDVTAPAAASLAAIPLPQAQEILAGLDTESLLIEHLPGRFSLHDLLRAYAADLANISDPPDDPCSALGRLFDYYLSMAAAAMDLLHPAEAQRRPSIPLSAAPAPDLDSPEAALTWLDAERRNLVAVTAYATTHGWPQHAVLLSSTVERYFEGGHHYQGLSVHNHARAAAKQANDLDGEANAIRALGALHWRLGSPEQAAYHMRYALALYRRTGNRLGQARCLLVLGSLEAGKGRSSTAIRRLQRSLALFSQVGDRSGESAALNNLADALQRAGRTQQATQYLHRALGLSRQEGDRNVEAHALQTLGEVEQQSGHFELAAEHYQHALAVFRQIGHLRGEAWNLANLGTILNYLGHPVQAAVHHRQAIMLSRNVGDRLGEGVALNGLGEDAYAVGQVAEALSHHTAALALIRGTNNLEHQARAHVGLGQAHEALGEYALAQEHFQHAFKLYAELGHPDAELIYTKRMETGQTTQLRMN